MQRCNMHKHHQPDWRFLQKRTWITSSLYWSVWIVWRFTDLMEEILLSHQRWIWSAEQFFSVWTSVSIAHNQRLSWSCRGCSSDWGCGYGEGIACFILQIAFFWLFGHSKVIEIILQGKKKVLITKEIIFLY